MSDSVRPHRWQPTRLPCPWNSPGKNTGVGCHFLLQILKVKRERELTQSCPILSDPKDCGRPGSPVHGIFQARALECDAIAFSVSNFQFSIVTQSCPTLCNPVNRSTPGLPVHHHLPEFTQTQVHRVGDAMQPSHSVVPFSSAPNPSQQQGLFQ